MRKLLILLLIGTIPFMSNAQYGEVGLFAGASFYQGDLAPNSMTLQEIQAAYGLFAGYSPNDFWTVKAHFYRGRISGDDANQSSAALKERNLSFRSDISEFGVRGEFNIIGYQPANLYSRVSPFVFLGAAVFHHNPKAEYQDNWYELQPLGTEGQGISGYSKKYNRIEISIPIGGGVKFAIVENLNIGLELGLRKTFTDHLDDASGAYVDPEILIQSSSRGQLIAALANRSGEYLGGEPVNYHETGDKRGNSSNDDSYFMGGITISYNFISEFSYYGRRRTKPGSCKGARF